MNNDAAAALATMQQEPAPQPVEVTRAGPLPYAAPTLPSGAAAASVLSPQAPAQVYVQHPPAAYSATIVNVPQQKSASGFGIAALVIGIIAVLVCWIPLIGVIAIPLGLITLLLAAIGFIVSLVGRNSGVGLPVAGGFLGAMAVAVPLLWVGAFANAVGGAAARSKQTNQTIIDATLAGAAAGPAGTASPDFAMADQPVAQNGVLLQVNSVRLGKVKVRGSYGRGESLTKDVLVAVVINVTNTSPTRKVDFYSWGGQRLSFGSDGATLRDNFGNKYDLKAFDALAGPVEQDVPGSLYPSKSATDVVVFEPPVEGVTHLDLELPGRNAGGDGMFRIRIPASMIQKS